MERIRYVFLCLAMTTLLTSGVKTDDKISKDICTRHGIFKLTNRFHASDRQTLNIVLDLEDYFYVMSELERVSLSYIERLRNYTTMGGILIEHDKEFVDAIDHKVIFKLTGLVHTGSLACLGSGGNLIGMDSIHELSLIHI